MPYTSDRGVGSCVGFCARRGGVRAPHSVTHATDILLSSGCVAWAEVIIAKKSFKSLRKQWNSFIWYPHSFSGLYTPSDALGVCEWTESNTQIRDSSKQHSNKLLAGIMLWQCSLDFSVICIVIIWFYFVFRLVSYISISFLCPIHGSPQFNRIPEIARSVDYWTKSRKKGKTQRKRIKSATESASDPDSIGQ